MFPDGSKCAVVEFNDRKTVEKILETRAICLEGITLSLSQATRDLASFFSFSDTGDDDTIDAKNNIKMSPLDRTLTPPPACVLTTESGWSSPPRSVVLESLANDRSISQVETKERPSESNNRLTTIDVDVKPVRNDSPPNDLLLFVEQMKQDIEQTKNEYRLKFEQDQMDIQREFDLLISEERQTLEKLNRYVNDRRSRPDQRHPHTSYKRKYSPP